MTRDLVHLDSHAPSSATWRDHSNYRMLDAESALRPQLAPYDAPPALEHRLCNCPPTFARTAHATRDTAHNALAPAQPVTFRPGLTRWWNWPLKLLLELGAKLGVPTHTLSEWLQHREIEMPQVKEQEVIFHALHALETPSIAYRWLRASYAPGDAFTHLLRFVHLKRPLRADTPWDVTRDTLALWYADGWRTEALLHRINVVGEQLGHLGKDPLQRLRAIIKTAADAIPLTDPASPLAAMVEATDQQHAQLAQEAHRAERELLATILQHGALALHAAPAGTSIAVRVGAYEFLFSHRTAPQQSAHEVEHTTTYPAQLERLAMKLRTGVRITREEVGVLRAIGEENPALATYLAHHVAPLAHARADRARALDLLHTAALLPHGVLAESLEALAARDDAHPVGLEMPSGPRLVLESSSSTHHHATSLSAQLPPTYYLGPYHYSRGVVVRVDRTGTARHAAALVIRDRRGAIFHCTRAELAHLEALQTALDAGPAHAALRRALQELLSNIRAAWTAVRLPLRVPGGFSTHVALHADAIARTNWAVGLIHDIDHVWETAIALRRERERHPTMLLSTDWHTAVNVLHEHLARIATIYAAHFALAPRRAFLHHLRVLGTIGTAATIDVVAIKAELIALVTAAITPAVADAAWLSWPGARHPALVNHVRYLLSLTPTTIATTLANDAAELRAFTEEFITHEQRPTIAHASALHERGAVEEALAELRVLAATPRVAIRERLATLLQLIRWAAPIGHWSDVELGLRELAYHVLLGHPLPRSVVAGIGELLRTFPEGAYRFPTALQYALADELAASRIERLLWTPLGESAGRVDELLMSARTAPSRASAMPPPLHIAADRWTEFANAHHRRLVGWPHTTRHMRSPRHPRGMRASGQTAHQTERHAG